MFDTLVDAAVAILVLITVILGLTFMAGYYTAAGEYERPLMAAYAAQDKLTAQCFHLDAQCRIYKELLEGLGNPELLRIPPHEEPDD